MNRFQLPQTDDVNVIALVKNDERYVWLYRDCDRAAVLRSLGAFAADSDLSFTWYDAATLSRKIRQRAQES